MQVASTIWGWVVGLLALATVCGFQPALAQTYQPGQQLEYKAQSWPEKWEVGTFLKDLPGGTQVLIRQAPTQFFPQGFERAYSRDEVRPLTKAAPPPASTQARSLQPAPKAGLPGGGGLISQQDVLGFLRDRLGNGDPFMNPKREAVLLALREEILRRGVDFHHQAIGDFANELGKFGALSNVTYALSSNFGPPAKLNEMMGKWRLIKVGATSTFTRGDKLYQRQEYAGLAGSLTVNANGTYLWNSPSGVLKGNWRQATADEMAKSDKGGAGVVLLAAKSGADWLVFKRTEEGPEGTGIMITDLATRNLRERGTR